MQEIMQEIQIQNSKLSEKYVYSCATIGPVYNLNKLHQGLLLSFEKQWWNSVHNFASSYHYLPSGFFSNLFSLINELPSFILHEPLNLLPGSIDILPIDISPIILAVAFKDN